MLSKISRILQEKLWFHLSGIIRRVNLIEAGNEMMMVRAYKEEGLGVNVEWEKKFHFLK